MNCAVCGKFVSIEEHRERYEELKKTGVIPMMISMCKECRESDDPWKANKFLKLRK